MSRTIVLDSSPLGLLFQKPRFADADRCRDWLKGHLALGAQVIVPEIIVYELRRELLRMGHKSAARSMHTFVHAKPGRFLPITTAAMDHAAELWAEARRRGKPTADPHALDVDVILAAQVLTAGLQPGGYVVATTNVSHLSQFVICERWDAI
jgi:predicted nucleic acid-binding protein